MLSILLLLTTPALANDCMVYLSKMDSRKGTYELVANRDGSNIGRLVYAHNYDTTRIELMYIDEEQRRTGVGTDLIRHMLDREKFTREVSAILVMDNYNATGLSKLKDNATEAECIEGVRKSPLYKSISRFGFSKIVRCVHLVRAGLVTILVESQ